MLLRVYAIYLFSVIALSAIVPDMVRVFATNHTMEIDNSPLVLICDDICNQGFTFPESQEREEDGTVWLDLLETEPNFKLDITFNLRFVVVKIVKIFPYLSFRIIFNGDNFTPPPEVFFCSAIS